MCIIKRLKAEENLRLVLIVNNWKLNGRKILFSILFFTMSSFSLLAAEINTDEYAVVASKYRSYPVAVWGREVLKFLPFVGTKAGIKICLHHLAGNAMHIAKMYAADDSYFQDIRTRERSQKIKISIYNEPIIDNSQPDDIVIGRNSRTDLIMIIDIFRRWETLEKKSDTMNQFYREVKVCKEMLEPYRRQRKLTFERHYIENPRFQGFDHNNEPRLLEIIVDYPKLVRRFLNQ